MEYPVCKIDACEYNQLNRHTQVFNINSIEYFMYIYLPPELVKNLQLFQVDKISPDKFEIPIVGFIDKDHSCWLKVKSEILSKSAGQHVYKLSFIDSCSRDIVPLYFSYIIQDDNPNKPYIYMKDINICTSTACSNCTVSGCKYQK